MSKTNKLFAWGSAILALCIPASAATIGTFSMSGLTTVTPTTITWQTDAPGNAANLFTTTLGTGIYSTEDGQNAIDNLNIASEPVGSTFGPFPFIQWLVDTSVANLLIDYIQPGIYSSAQCGAPAAAGQVCTLPGSPFNFVNNTATSSTASWNFAGVTADGLTWSAIFTSQFANMNFQQVLTQLSTTGSVKNSYSAAEVTVNSPVPEPGPLSMVSLGAGLLMLSLSIRKFRRN